MTRRRQPRFPWPAATLQRVPPARPPQDELHAARRQYLAAFAGWIARMPHPGPDAAEDEIEGTVSALRQIVRLAKSGGRRA